MYTAAVRSSLERACGADVWDSDGGGGESVLHNKTLQNMTSREKVFKTSCVTYFATRWSPDEYAVDEHDKSEANGLASDNVSDTGEAEMAVHYKCVKNPICYKTQTHDVNYKYANISRHGDKEADRITK